MTADAAPHAKRPLRDRRLRSALVLALIALVSALVCVAAVKKIEVLTSLNSFIQDWEISYLSPPRPIDPDIVIVAVREDTLRQFPYRSPLDRAFLNGVLTKIAAAKPKVIGLDFLLDQPTEPDKDNLLKATIAALPVPLVIAYTEDPGNVTPDQLAYLRTFVPPSRRAMANVAKDAHGTVRQVYPGEKDAAGRYVPGFERAIAAYAGVKTRPVPRQIVWTRPPAGDRAAFPEFDAQAVGIFPPQLFHGKIVLIGSDVSLVDRHRTPFTAASDKGILPGIFVHAYGVATLLHPELSPYTGLGLNIAIALALSLLGAILGVLDFNLLLRIAAAVAILAVFWVAAAELCAYGNTIVGLLAPSLAAIVSFSAMDSLSGRDARKQRQFIQGAFSRYVSPKVVEALIADPTRMSLEGERREMTFLFSDLANFTTMSEGMDSQDVARMLNVYFDGVTSIVLRYEGMVDKFIGDGVFAIFNAPVDLPNHAERCISCAMEVDDFCEDFRKKQNAAGIKLGVTRIGIHTGPAVIGNFGSTSRFNYTAQGDAVNTASRLEGLNKLLGTRLCVSGDARNRCTDITFRPIASVVLKGKGHPVKVWQPLRDGAITPDRLARYDEAYGLLDTTPGKALELFEALAQESPNDPCVGFHLRRLRGGLRGADLVMTEK